MQLGPSLSDFQVIANVCQAAVQFSKDPVAMTAAMVPNQTRSLFATSGEGLQTSNLLELIGRTLQLARLAMQKKGLT